MKAVDRDRSQWVQLGEVEPNELARPDQRRSRVLVAVGCVVALVALAVGISIVRSDNGTSERQVLTTRDAKTLFAALAESTGTGGYWVEYEFVIEPAAEGPRVTVTGRGTVQLNPYFMVTTSTVSGLGEITIRTDGNLITEQGGADYGKLEEGQPISEFASAVQSTFGQGPGALTMLGLASPTGYLSLSAEAVTDVSAAGTGMVGDTPVTYYDVVSDVEAMLDLPGLTDEQRKTVDAALTDLRESGFVESTSRIAVDADGYIRESSSVARFGDGTTMTRHLTLSRFGCIGTGPTPANPAGSAASLPPECSHPPAGPMPIPVDVPPVPATEATTTTVTSP